MSNTLVEIDKDIFSAPILLLLIQKRLVSVTKRQYLHEEMVNHLVKLAQEKVWLG